MLVDKLREENYKLKFELKMTTVKFNNLSLENARLKRDINAKTTKEIIKLENEYKSNINNLNKIIDDKDKEIDALKAEIAKIIIIVLTVVFLLLKLKLVKRNISLILEKSQIKLLEDKKVIKNTNFMLFLMKMLMKLLRLLLNIVLIVTVMIL